MTPAALAGRQVVYLRPDAIQRLTAHVDVPGLNRKQQAAILGLPYTMLWRMTNAGQRATDLAIAEILTAAQRVSARWHTDPLGFDDLFEIRPAA